MFRRKTRNSTAYTGVGHASPAAQQPNTNAMAAALSIGDNLRESNPDKYGHNPSYSLRNSQGQARSHGSLLKRSSSISGSQIRATSTPNTSRASSNVGANHQGQPRAAPARASSLRSGNSGHQISYSVDDSFTDSTLEQMGHEADAHYSNRAKMSDLKLNHTPAPPPVKMVKKYVPTPNGIQVIEVPEATLKKEIARSNSLRSGMSLGRPTLRSIPRLPSMSGAQQLSINRPSQRSRTQRQSSMLSTPKIVENVELEKLSASEAALAEQKAERELLKRQIAEEERLAKELEAQRLEFERLKELRLKNEQRMRALRELEDEEQIRSRTLSPVSDLIPTTLSDGHEKVPTVVGAFQSESQPKVEDDDEEDVPIEPLPFVVDELEKKEIEKDVADGTMVPANDVPISHPAPVATDELDKKRLEDAADAPTSEYSLEVPSFVSSSRKVPDEAHGNDKDFGIEAVPTHEFDTPNLAKQLRPVFDPIDVQHIDSPSPSPRFDPVPEIIENHLTGRLTPPPLNLAAASIKSGGSLDSKSSRPIKSALKMPKAAYLSKNAQSESPAHQAYLSLTTAENTRLNSKLSSAQLSDANGLVPPEGPSPPKSPVTPLKRMSQTLRKAPSSTTPTANAMSGRSLRPRSQSDVSQTSRANGGGMSSRTFKTQPQPIPPHPALQPNYQSPSKLKAAELYAKANSRPKSQFQPPVKRQSSFTKHQDASKGENAPPGHFPQQPNHRTTLRSGRVQSHVPPAYTDQAAAAPSTAPTAAPARTGGFKAFKSRYADSDDEDSSYPVYAAANTALSSRFNDSNDDLRGASVNAPPKTAGRDEVMHTPIISLRKDKNETPKEEKPKKKKFLRKLFGKN